MSIEGLSINGQVKKYLYDSLDNKESIEDRVTTLEEGGLNLKDEVITAEIDNWLNDHPEATTTVQDDSLITSKYKDGSVTKDKLADEAVTSAKISQDILSLPYYSNVVLENGRLYNTDYYIVTVPAKDESGNYIPVYLDYNGDKNPLEQADAAGTNLTTNGGCSYYDENVTVNGGWVHGFMISNGEVMTEQVIPGGSLQGKSYAEHGKYIGIKADRTIIEYDTDSSITAAQMLADGCENVFNAYLKIAENGVVLDLSNVGRNGGATGKNPRMCLGVKSNKDLVFFSCDGRTAINDGFTMPQVGDFLIAKGCQDVYNLDGGGSACLVYRGSKQNRNIDDDGAAVRDIHYTINVRRPGGSDAIRSANGNTGTEKQSTIAQVIPYINYLNAEINNTYMYRNLARNKDITDAWYNGSLKSEVSNGNFANVRPGDYIIGTSSGKKYLVADLDLYYYTGSSALGSHHLVMISGERLGRVKMNDSNVTTGGYLASEMKTTTLPSMITNYLTPDFGNNLLSYTLPLTSNVNTSNVRDSGLTGQATSWSWQTSKCDLLNETAVFGHRIWGAARDDGLQAEQLAIFRLWGTMKVFGRNDIWLRDIASRYHYSIYNYQGGSDYADPTTALDVYPWFLLG